MQKFSLVFVAVAILGFLSMPVLSESDSDNDSSISSEPIKPKEKKGLDKITSEAEKLCEFRYKDSEAKQLTCQENMHEGFLGVTGFLLNNRIDKLDIKKEMENGNWMAQIFAACSAKWKRPEGFYWDKINKCIELEMDDFENKKGEYADDI